MTRVSDLVIDSRDGHIVFLALSGVEGKGDALVAVPFSLLSKKGRNRFVLHIMDDRLAEAPGFQRCTNMGSH